VDSSTDLMSLLNANSYQKGGWVLHMLRNDVGDTVFRRIIQQYYRQYKGGNADTRDFEKVAETVSGKDLKGFFDQWLYRAGIPKLSFSTKKIGQEFHVIIRQQGPVYVLPLEIKVIYDDGSAETVKLDFRTAEMNLNVKARMPRSIILDPASKLLIWY
jgi:aminopeptidase N